MKRSDSRILTTHTGSLPRSDELTALLVEVNEGRLEDRERFDRLVGEAIDDVVRRQLAAGIDIGGDGELPRVAFHLYVKDRMSGFGGRTTRASISDMPVPGVGGADARDVHARRRRRRQPVEHGRARPQPSTACATTPS